MSYITEYEVIDSKFCGIVKNPYSGSPVFITDLCNTQEEAATKISSYVANNQHILDEQTPKKSCCGRW